MRRIIIKTIFVTFIVLSFLYIFSDFSINFFYNYYFYLISVIVIIESYVLYKVFNSKKIKKDNKVFYSIIISIIFFIFFTWFDYIISNNVLDIHQNNLKFNNKDIFDLVIKEDDSANIYNNVKWVDLEWYYFSIFWGLQIWLKLLWDIFLLLFPLFWPFVIISIMDEDFWENIKFFILITFIIWVISATLSWINIIMFFIISFLWPILYIKVIDIFFNGIWTPLKFILVWILSFYSVYWGNFSNTLNFFYKDKLLIENAIIISSNKEIKNSINLSNKIEIENYKNKEWNYYLYTDKCELGKYCYFKIWKKQY